MGRRFTILAATASAVVLAACATAGNSGLTNKVSLDSIKPNETTKADISRMFGAPSGNWKSGDGSESWSYNYTSISMVPFFSSADIRQLTVHFDKDGKVTQYSTNKNGF